jgi:hypothetical protein
VLVVPIGNNSLFDNHFQVVSRLRDVPFYELNRPVTKNTNPAFKYFNWGNGNLLFDYLRYDRVARGPGDLDNFQVGDISASTYLFGNCNFFIRAPNVC